MSLFSIQLLQQSAGTHAALCKEYGLLFTGRTNDMLLLPQTLKYHLPCPENGSRAGVGDRSVFAIWLSSLWGGHCAVSWKGMPLAGCIDDEMMPDAKSVFCSHSKARH